MVVFSFLENHSGQSCNFAAFLAMKFYMRLYKIIPLAYKKRKYMYTYIDIYTVSLSKIRLHKYTKDPSMFYYTKMEAMHVLVLDELMWLGEKEEGNYDWYKHILHYNRSIHFIPE